MPPRDGSDQPLSPDLAVLQPIGGDWPGEKPNVQRALRKFARLDIAGQLAQLQHHAWTSALELPQQRREETVLDRRDETHRQIALLAARGSLHDKTGLIDLHQNLA